MSAWSRGIASVAAIAAALLFSGVTSAAPSGPVPESLEPADGAGFQMEVSVPVFRVRDTAQSGYGVWLRVSRSPQTGPDGTLDGDAGSVQLRPDPGDPTVFTLTSTSANAWTTTPGTYYWQAHRIDSTGDQDGRVVGPVMSFTVTPPPAPSVGSPASGKRYYAGAAIPLEVRAHVRGPAEIGVEFSRSPETRPDGMFARPWSSLPAVGQAGTYSATLPGSATERWSGTIYWHPYRLCGSGCVVAGKTRTVRIVVPATHRSLIPRYIGRRTRAAFHVNPASFGGVPRARWLFLAKTTGRRWGLRYAGTTSRSPLRRDGRSVVGFAAWVPPGNLGATIVRVRRVYLRRMTCRVFSGVRVCHQEPPRFLRTEVVERDIAISTAVHWQAGPWHPNGGEYDLESVLLHEFGHFAGNRGHASRCANSPLNAAAAAGEWWRSPGEWNRYGCANSAREPRSARTASTAVAPPRRRMVVRRIVLPPRYVPAPGREPGAAELFERGS
jgi:hypothetical protein